MKGLSVARPGAKTVALDFAGEPRGGTEATELVKRRKKADGAGLKGIGRKDRPPCFISIRLTLTPHQPSHPPTLKVGQAIMPLKGP